MYGSHNRIFGRENRWYVVVVEIFLSTIKDLNTFLHAGSQVGGPISVAPAQDEDTGKRLIRSATEKEGEDKTKKKSEKRKGKKRKAIVKKGKSVDKVTQKNGKRQRLDNQGKKNNKTKKLKGRRRTKQSIVFTGENCDIIDFASVRALSAGCADGTKMVVKNK